MATIVLIHYIFVQELIRLVAYHHHSYFLGPMPNTNNIMLAQLLQTIPYEWILRLQQYEDNFYSRGKFLPTRRQPEFAHSNYRYLTQSQILSNKHQIGSTMVSLTRQKIHSHIDKNVTPKSNYLAAHGFVIFDMLAYKPLHHMWICKNLKPCSSIPKSRLPMKAGLQA